VSARDNILKATAFKAETVHIDEWDTDVEVRSVSLAERNRLLGELRARQLVDEASLFGVYPLIIIATAYDPDTGERLFGDDETDLVGTLDPVATDKLANVAMRLLGFTQVDLDAPKAGS
jgi:hypothetical protein